MDLDNQRELGLELDLSIDSDDGMSRDRFSGSAVFALLAFALLCLVGLLFPIPLGGRGWDAAGNLTHAPLFAAIAVVLIWAVGRRTPTAGGLRSMLARSLLIAASVFAFGVAIEVLQSMSGRTAAVHDAVANGLGITAGLLTACAVRIWRQPHSRWTVTVLLTLSVASIAAASRQPLLVLYDVWSVQSKFPLLASFESPLEFDRFYFHQCTPHWTDQDVTEGSHAMEVRYAPVHSPSATLTEKVEDWSRLNTLELDVTVDQHYAGSQLVFVIRIANRDHVTFQKQWELKPGQLAHLSIRRGEIVTPQSDPISLSRIDYLDLGIIDPVEAVNVRIDRLRLTLGGAAE